MKPTIHHQPLTYTPTPSRAEKFISPSERQPERFNLAGFIRVALFPGTKWNIFAHRLAINHLHFVPPQNFQKTGNKLEQFGNILFQPARKNMEYGNTLEQKSAESPHPGDLGVHSHRTKNTESGNPVRTGQHFVPNSSKRNKKGFVWWVLPGIYPASAGGGRGKNAEYGNPLATLVPAPNKKTRNMATLRQHLHRTKPDVLPLGEIEGLLLAFDFLILT
jgi:hypothetical protein